MELAALAERIKALEVSLVEHGLALRSQSDALNETRRVVIELNARFSVPGQSQWCVEHMKRLDRFEGDVAALKGYLNRALGCLAALIVVLNIAVPVVLKFWKP